MTTASADPVARLDWLFQQARAAEETDESWRALEKYFLGMIALFRQSPHAKEQLTAAFVDCATGRRPSAYPQIAYCMRELQLNEVRVAIVADAEAHKSPEPPTEYDEYYARHMSYWSDIHQAFASEPWDDYDMWAYYSGRRWLEERSFAPGLRGLLLQSRLNIGSSSDAVDWAQQRLVEGADSPSLILLAGLSKPPNGFEVIELLESVHGELGGQAKDTAVLAKEHLVEIALDSLAGLRPMDEGLMAGFKLARAIDIDDELAVWSAAKDDFSLARDGITDPNEATVKANERLLDRVERVLR